MNMLIKNMKNKLSLTLVFAGILICDSKPADASNFDIANLAIFRAYVGKDVINGGAYCGLSASSIRERLNRSEQDYRVWSYIEKNQLSLELKLKNSKRNFEGTSVGPKQDSFSIAIENYTLVLIGQKGYPVYLYSFQLFDNSCGVNCSQELIRCEVQRWYF